MQSCSIAATYFNPRPHEEGDFQPRAFDEWWDYFNPRPHEEGDAAPVGGKRRRVISIHALTRRATASLSNNTILSIAISIHALTRRATGLLTYSLTDSYISIHALTRRATSAVTLIMRMNLISIHALTRRATQNNLTGIPQIRFQSTPSRGGRPAC